MKKPYSFGIIGCGFIAGVHAAAITSLDNTAIYGVYDAAEKAADAFCEKWKTRKFSSVDALFSSDEIDIVCICTPSGTHASLAVGAMESGKHVIVEKPMALTPEECRLVADTQEKTGKKCTVIFQRRFSETSAKVRTALREGRLGKLIKCGVHMNYYRSEEYYRSSAWRGTSAMDGGGALMNQGIHGVDLMLSYMGEVKSVFALCKTLRHDIEVEDTADAVVEFESGAIGVIEAATSVYPGYPLRIELCGSRGSIIMEDEAILCWDIDGEEAKGREQDKSSALSHSTHADPTKVSVTEHRAQIENLLRHLTYGDELLVDAQEGRKSVELICAIYESSGTGQKIMLKQEK